MKIFDKLELKNVTYKSLNSLLKLKSKIKVLEGNEVKDKLHLKTLIEILNPINLFKKAQEIDRNAAQENKEYFHNDSTLMLRDILSSNPWIVNLLE
jgi:hypothetical protein